MVELVELQAGLASHQGFLLIILVEDDKDEDYITDDEAEDRNDEYDDDAESDDEDDSFAAESIYERLYALVDVIPYSKRRSAYLAADQAIRSGFGWAHAASKGLWVLATGALLIALPVALEIEREHFAMSQEAAQRGQLQAQAVPGSSPSP
ncbi:hypothetical protein HDU67_001808 [Dinochytrium kinnereticum]|nr:hypothetical protein HDU67_001808 [Dinochytrium kinnereticum]